jgi:carbon storage regulator
MLVLTRQVGEVIVIAGNIRVEVLEARQGMSRLGITAPKEITIDRLEVHEAKLRAAGGHGDAPGKGDVPRVP